MNKTVCKMVLVWGYCDR